jgi:hypothetical protein
VDNIFAYETNGMHRQFFKEWHSHITPGFGGRYVMDDANVPVSYFYRLSILWIIEALQLVSFVPSLPGVFGQVRSSIYSNTETTSLKKQSLLFGWKDF